MVVPLGPGKFYGSSLPRPRIYNDVKLNDERVDPPAPVLDPLLSWAQEAHWSMGGLSFKRLRLQGRIEGNIKKLRVEREKFFKKRNLSPAVTKPTGKFLDDSPPPTPIATKRKGFTALVDEESDDEEFSEEKSGEKGRNEGDAEIRVSKKRRLARKLGDDFDRVAMRSPLTNQSNGSKVTETVALRTRSREAEKKDAAAVVATEVKAADSQKKKLKRVGERETKKVLDSGSSPTGQIRVSPRLAKRGSA